MQKDIRSLGNYIDNLQFTRNKNEYKDIISVEHRSNNPKRDYLFVNRIQAKHIPCNPIRTVEMCSDLALIIKNELDDKYSNILAIGFAETATGIAGLVASEVPNIKYLMCTTREDIDESVGHEVITFEEEHSHATTQKLFTWNKKGIDFKKFDYILFIEDEISTGNTILNFIKAFKEQKVITESTKFGVASICNWQDEENKKKFNGIDTFALITGQLKDVHAKMGIKESDIRSNYFNTCENKQIREFTISGTDYFNSSRLGAPIDKHKKLLSKIVAKAMDRLRHDLVLAMAQYVDVIGTEECMEPAIRIAYDIMRSTPCIAKCHATTRSKIDTLINSDTLTMQHHIKSAYSSDRDTYIYNTEIHSDLVIIVTDSNKTDEFIRSIKNKLNTDMIILIKLT